MVKTGLIGDQLSSEWCNFLATITLFNQVIHPNDKVQPKSCLVSLKHIWKVGTSSMLLTSEVDTHTSETLHDHFSCEVYCGRDAADSHLKFWCVGDGISTPTVCKCMLSMLPTVKTYRRTHLIPHACLHCTVHFYSVKSHGWFSFISYFRVRNKRKSSVWFSYFRVQKWEAININSTNSTGPGFDSTWIWFFGLYTHDVHGFANVCVFRHVFELSWNEKDWYVTK